MHGTTGYNFLNDLNGLFVDMLRTRGACGGCTRSPPGAPRRSTTSCIESKRLIMDTAMASELNVLAHMLDRIGESNRRSRDFTLNSLRDMHR